MDRRVLIICNGEPPSRSLLLRLAARADGVIAADGGANIARGCGITPDVIIGDLDSISPTTRTFFSSTSIVKVARQDNTDLEKALDYVMTTGASEVWVAGATGGRIDFTFGNFSVVWNYPSRLRVTFVGDGWHATRVISGEPVSAKRGTVISLIPFGPCSGITLKGLKYSLSNSSMRVGEIGVSNVVRKSPFSVTVRRGKMMMFVMEGI